nr:hypothetical protein Q903MT_gene6437 [Picea sitchensis]
MQFPLCQPEKTHFYEIERYLGMKLQQNCSMPVCLGSCYSCLPNIGWNEIIEASSTPTHLPTYLLAIYL